MVYYSGGHRLNYHIGILSFHWSHGNTKFKCKYIFSIDILQMTCSDLEYKRIEIQYSSTCNGHQGDITHYKFKLNRLAIVISFPPPMQSSLIVTTGYSHRDYKVLICTDFIWQPILVSHLYTLNIYIYTFIYINIVSQNMQIEKYDLLKNFICITMTLKYEH